MGNDGNVGQRRQKKFKKSLYIQKITYTFANRTTAKPETRGKAVQRGWPRDSPSDRG